MPNFICCGNARSLEALYVERERDRKRERLGGIGVLLLYITGRTTTVRHIQHLNFLTPFETKTRDGLVELIISILVDDRESKVVLSD